MLFSTTQNTTFFLKDQTNRTRPNQSNDDSFPSNHAGKTAVVSMLVSRNMEDEKLSHSNTGSISRIKI
jgi:hypothetical protein